MTATFNLKADSSLTYQLGEFLSFLERDLRERPQRLREVDAVLIARARRLVAGVEVDLDEPLSPNEE